MSLRRGAAGGPGMISGGMKPLRGCAAADGPSTTAEHPVSSLQAAHRESHSVTTITSVSHVHRWLQIGGRPSLAHENHVEPTEMGHSLPPLLGLKTPKRWFCLMQCTWELRGGLLSLWCLSCCLRSLKQQTPVKDEKEKRRRRREGG